MVLIGANWFIAAHSMKRLMTKDHFLDLRDVHLMRNCTVLVAKTKALISFAVTAKLICAFVFA